MKNDKYLGCLEFNEGFFEVVYKSDTNTIDFGTVCNAGFAPMFTFECDDWQTLDANLCDAEEAFTNEFHLTEIEF